YPGDVPLGFEASGNVNGGYDQLWNSLIAFQSTSTTGGSSRTENSAHHTSNQYMYGANADLSIGWGRVRDATPVFSALLLEERLQRDHMLARTLSVDARN